MPSWITPVWWDAHPRATTLALMLINALLGLCCSALPFASRLGPSTPWLLAALGGVYGLILAGILQRPRSIDEVNTSSQAHPDASTMSEPSRPDPVPDPHLTLDDHGVTSNATLRVNHISTTLDDTMGKADRPNQVLAPSTAADPHVRFGAHADRDALEAVTAPADESEGADALITFALDPVGQGAMSGHVDRFTCDEITHMMAEDDRAEILRPLSGLYARPDLVDRYTSDATTGVVHEARTKRAVFPQHVDHHTLGAETDAMTDLSTLGEPVRAVEIAAVPSSPDLLSASTHSTHHVPPLGPRDPAALTATSAKDWDAWTWLSKMD